MEPYRSPHLSPDRNPRETARRLLSEQWLGVSEENIDTLVRAREVARVSQRSARHPYLGTVVISDSDDERPLISPRRYGTRSRSRSRRESSAESAGDDDDEGEGEVQEGGGRSRV